MAKNAGIEGSGPDREAEAILDYYRRPLESSLSGAFYDASTAAIWMPVVDLGSHEEFDIARLERTHENFHWLQHVASACGRTQSLLRKMRDNFACLYLSHHTNKADITRRWKTERDFVILPLRDAAWYLESTIPATPHNLAAKKFYATLVADIALDDLRLARKLTKEPMRCVYGALVESDAFLASQPARVDVLRLESFLKTAVEVEPICTTKDLQESVVLALEFAFEVFNATADYSFAERVHSLKGSGYTAPIMYAAREWGRDIGDMRSFLLPFIAVIDVALDIPLPPNGSMSSLNWTDVYSPIRFIRAVHGAKKVQWLDWNSKLDAEAFKLFRGEVASASDLPLAGRSRPVNLHGKGSFEAWTRRDLAENPVELSVHDLVALCQDHVCEFGSQFDLGWHSDPIVAMTGNATVTHWVGEKTTIGEVDRNLFAFVAPFVVTRTGVLFSRVWPAPASQAMFETGIRNYCLFDYFTKPRRKIQYLPFPREHMEPELMDRLQQELRAQIDEISQTSLSP